MDVKPATLTDTWVKVSGYITAPANAYRGRMWTAISASTNHPQGMSFLIDDIFIMDVTEGRKGVTDSAANATAISTTNTEVARIDGRVVANASAIDKLSVDLASVDTRTGNAINAAADAQQTANLAVTNDAATATKVSGLESTFNTYKTDNDKAVKQVQSNLTSTQTTLASADKALGTRVDTLTTTVSNNKTKADAGIKEAKDATSALDSSTALKVSELTASIANAVAGTKSVSDATAKSFEATNASVKKVGDDLVVQANKVVALESRVDGVNSTVAGYDQVIDTWADVNRSQAVKIEKMVAELVPHMAGNDSFLVGDTESPHSIVGYEGVITSLADANAATQWAIEKLEAKYETEYAKAAASVEEMSSIVSNVDEAIASKFTELSSNFQTTIDDVITPKFAEYDAKLQNELLTMSDVNGAVAEATQTLTTTLDGTITNKISEVTSSINGVKAVKTVTIDNNGILSGYGLISEIQAGKVTSAFGVNADQFYVGSPKTGKKVFAVVDGQTVINDAVIGNLSATKITTGTMHGDRITAGTITADKLEANALKVESLSSVSATIGLLRTKESGARVEISDNLIQVFDSEGNTRIKLGIF